MDGSHRTGHPVPAPDGAADQGGCDPLSRPATDAEGFHEGDGQWNGKAPGMKTHAIPAVLQPARFVPRHSARHREPMRVPAWRFTEAGLPVPENRAQWNIYQLTRRQGMPWSPAVDYLTSLHGSEILPGPFVCVDCDTHLAIDGTVWLDGFRWLADRAVEAGSILDPSATLAVRTSGHPGRGHDPGHAPGWHLWYVADPNHPVRTGPLARCRAVEIKTRCTAPGSPGYTVRHAPPRCPSCPRGWWLSPGHPGSR